MKLPISLIRQIPKLSPICRKYSACENEIDLKAVVGKKIAKEQKRVGEFRKKHGAKVVGEINVNMLYGGMRGLLGLIYETSLLDPESGITFRGYDIPTLKKKLPPAEGGCEPLPEGIFWLLLTGKIPTKEEVQWVSRQWACRSELPPYVPKILAAMPKTMHPMVQLSCAIASMNHDGKFQAAYNKGVKKAVYWEYVYEDAMDLLARIIKIAAIVYKNTYKNRESIGEIDECADWSQNFSTMMGYEDPECIEMFRLYLTLHCDHEGGNVSAHTAHIVGSALSDCYLSYSAALNGLAGPLHGLANQMVLVWLMKMQKTIGKDLSDEKIKSYVQDTIKSGSVVPGYGHAVLRKTDPRYVAQHEFAQAHFPDYPLNKLVAKLYKIVPEVLKGVKKVRNPWPNVDAHSGVLLQYYGIKEMNYYTVMFGVSRAIGVLAMMVWSRALGFAIERPKSITTNNLEKMLESKK